MKSSFWLRMRSDVSLWSVVSTSGTPGYKAPEQWLGQPQESAADQYALGVIAYKLFAGRLPFDGDDIRVLGQAVLNAPAPKIPTASSVVNAALAKALAKKPEDRFSSCAAFVAAFAGKVRVVPKRPVGKAIAVASLLVFLAGGGLVYKHQVDRQEAARVAKVAADEKAKAEEEKRQAEEKAAREKAEAEAKRLADEKAAREKAEAAAKQPKPQSVDETEVQQQIAELRRLQTLIDIKRTGLREAVEKVAPYRDDADGFAAHLATVDAAVKGLENAKDPADVSGAKALAERLGKAVDTVAVELKWLETNKAARDKAKAIDGEIVSLEPELVRVKAEEAVPARLAEGRQLQTKARKLLADGAFESAAQTFGGAKAKLVLKDAGQNVRLTIPMADGNPESRVYAYDIVVSGDDPEQRLIRSAYFSGCNAGMGHEPDGGRTNVDLPKSLLPAGKTLTFSVRPLSSLGTSGKAIVVKSCNVGKSA